MSIFYNKNKNRLDQIFILHSSASNEIYEAVEDYNAGNRYYQERPKKFRMFNVINQQNGTIKVSIAKNDNPLPYESLDFLQKIEWRSKLSNAIGMSPDNRMPLSTISKIPYDEFKNHRIILNAAQALVDRHCSDSDYETIRSELLEIAKLAPKYEKYKTHQEHVLFLLGFGMFVTLLILSFTAKCLFSSGVLIAPALTGLPALASVVVLILLITAIMFIANELIKLNSPLKNKEAQDIFKRLEGATNSMMFFKPPSNSSDRSSGQEYNQHAMMFKPPSNSPSRTRGLISEARQVENGVNSPGLTHSVS